MKTFEKEEKELFKKKLELSKLKLMGHFIRKSVLEAPILVIDMNEFRKLQTLIGRNVNNFNQIAKRVNTTSYLQVRYRRSLKRK